MNITALQDPFGFSRLSVGYDEILKRLSEFGDGFPGGKIPVFPPYNIKKISENEYLIEMAVAGFGKQDITVTMENGSLIIKGNLSQTDKDTEFLYKGIAERAFTRTFNLADTVEVKNAELLNGMLKIFLERFIPESQKPKSIEINDGSKKK